MRKKSSKNIKKDIKNRLVTNKEQSKNEIWFRNYLKEYHPNKYKQLLELESKKENKTIVIEICRSNVNDVKNLPKSWTYEIVVLDNTRGELVKW